MSRSFTDKAMCGSLPSPGMTAVMSIISGLMMTLVFAGIHQHGPSGEARTPGLMVPNHALYRLGYTRVYFSKINGTQTAFTALSASVLSDPGGFHPIFCSSIDYLNMAGLEPTRRRSASLPSTRFLHSRMPCALDVFVYHFRTCSYVGLVSGSAPCRTTFEKSDRYACNQLQRSGSAPLNCML